MNVLRPKPGDPFRRRCHRILDGLGMPGDQRRAFDAAPIEHACFVEVNRESSDGMFRCSERWLCAFARRSHITEAEFVDSLLRAAILNKADFAFVVVFGSLSDEVSSRLRQDLSSRNCHLVLLRDRLTDSLVADCREESDIGNRLPALSFRRLRDHVISQYDETVGTRYFQTINALPNQVLALNPSDKVLDEADLVRVLREGNALLLGEPGSGKTTSLMALAHDLARVGGLVPVFIPLTSYRGDFWAMLAEALAPGALRVDPELTRQLVCSGALVIILDGINEIQNRDFRSRISGELDDLTKPGAPAACSRWIVSCRVCDYEHAAQKLANLERHRWELQPLTADMIYRVAVETLGTDNGRSLYAELDESILDLCGNPLLLAMLLTVYRGNHHPPTSRLALYREFVNELLTWGPGDQETYDQIGTALGRALSQDSYVDVARQVLAGLAAAMTSPEVSWRDASALVKRIPAIAEASDSTVAASALLNDLTRRGILRLHMSIRLRFFHHTVQEYFQAVAMQATPGTLLRESPSPERREMLVFLAGLVPDPTPLVRTALATDSRLAFDMVQEAPKRIPADLMKLLASDLWKRSLEGSVVGDRRDWAVRFRRLARLQDISIEDLAAEVDCRADRDQHRGALAAYYQETGDQQGLLQTLEKIGPDSVSADVIARAAIAATQLGQHERAVELSSQYLSQNPDSSAMLTNRAAAYRAQGRMAQALADCTRAVALDPHPCTLTHYARLLHEEGNTNLAVEQLQIALATDRSYADANSLLADLIETEKPEEALHCRLQAVSHFPDNESLFDECGRLARLETKLGHLADAMRTYKRMIMLQPTSSLVPSWKNQIAELRRAIDDDRRSKSARDQIQTGGEISFPSLVVAWLANAGISVSPKTTNLVSAEVPRYGEVPVMMVSGPSPRPDHLRDVLSTIPQSGLRGGWALMVTEATTLDSDARYEWASMQRRLKVGLLSTPELRHALLANQSDCYRLLEQALERAGKQSDPYSYTGYIQEGAEFYGRKVELADCMGLIRQSQQFGLYGINKIGKSSLLRRLRQECHAQCPSITILHLELDGQDRCASDFYQRVLHELPNAPKFRSDRPVSSRAFQRVLNECHDRRASKQPGHRFLLILDEYLHLIPRDCPNSGMPDVVDVLNVLKSLHDTGPLSVLPCGWSAVLTRQPRFGQRENPFVDLLSARFLGPLTREENDGLMRALGRRATVELAYTDDALAAVYAETGGHPQLSRRLGSQLLHGGLQEVTPSSVGAASQAVLDSPDSTSSMRTTLDSWMDSEERRIAQMVALGKGTSRRDLLPHNAEDAQRQRTRDAIDNLVAASILAEDTATGRLSHRYGMLAKHIRRRCLELGLPES